MEAHIRALLPRFQYSEQFKETAAFRIVFGGEEPSHVMADLDGHNSYTLRNWVNLYRRKVQTGSLKALEMALQSEQPHPVSLVHHSDRESQYCSFSSIQRLRQAGIALNMTQHGDPHENAVAERVNGILKTDFRLNRVLTTFDEAARAVEQSVRNDNHLRPHMSC